MSQPISFHTVIPVLRIFDKAKAKEFYIDFLGFSIDWQHRFGDNFPLYMQISRGSLVIQLTEHHGDCSPNAQIRIETSGLNDLQRELEGKEYRYMKPGIETVDGRREMTVVDPFANRLVFWEF